MLESYNTITYLRQYLSDLKSVPVTVDTPVYSAGNTVLDPSVPYYRTYLANI